MVCFRDPRTAWSAQQLVRYFYWCNAVLKFQKFSGEVLRTAQNYLISGPTGSGAWIPGLYRAISFILIIWFGFSFSVIKFSRFTSLAKYFHFNIFAFSGKQASILTPTLVTNFLRWIIPNDSLVGFKLYLKKKLKNEKKIKKKKLKMKKCLIRAKNSKQVAGDVNKIVE